MDIWAVRYSALATLEECAFWHPQLVAALAEIKRTIAEYESEGVNPEYLAKAKRAKIALGQRLFKLCKQQHRLKKAAYDKACLTTGG